MPGDRFDNDDEEPTRALPSSAPARPRPPASRSDGPTRLETPIPPPPDQPLPSFATPASAAQIGRYELLMELASGGMATVYVGRQRGAGGFERLVAIKRMHPHIASSPELAASFMDEARIASLIRHPNVVNVHDVHDAGRERLLVMDYVDGTSLAALVRTAKKRGAKLPRPVAVRIVVEALRGLHAAHEQVDLDGKPLAVVHRDATPHNVLLGSDGSVRITDFGIAKAAERSVHTATGLAKGKFRYMAPEQAAGAAIDRRVDIFAVGIVAWELLTGDRLFEGSNDAEILLKITQSSYPFPSKRDASIPAELERVVMRALCQDPNGRWATAHDFAQALEFWALEARSMAGASDVARVLDEYCGAPIRERRRLLSEIVAGTRPPVSLDGITRAPGMSGTSPTGATSAPLTLDSVKVVPALTRDDLRRYRVRRRLAMVGVGALGLAVAGALFLLLRTPPVAESVGVSTTSSAPVAVDPERVRIQVSSELEISEIRGSGVSNIEFAGKGASFELPRGDQEVRVLIRFSDESEISESVLPKENTAIRVRNVARTPEFTPEQLPKAAPGPGRGPVPAAKPVPGLEENPYE